MIQGARFDHRVDLISIAKGVLQRLEQNRTHPFSGHVSISTFPKTSASAVARAKVSLAQAQIFTGMYADIDAARNGKIDLSFAKLIARQMNCSERRRTHGIQRNAGAMKIEKVRNPICDGAVR